MGVPNIPNGQRNEIGVRVMMALDYVLAGDDIADMDDHYERTVLQIMEDMPIDKLSTAAKVAIAAVLIPEYARFARGGGGAGDPGRVLRLVPRDDGASAG